MQAVLACGYHYYPAKMLIIRFYLLSVRLVINYYYSKKVNFHKVRNINIVQSNSYCMLIIEANDEALSYLGKKYRYVRLSLGGNSRNGSTHYVQIKAFVGSTNVALNKTVTQIKGTREDTTALSRRVNGNQGSTNTYIWFSGASTLQVDLGDKYELNTITFWNYYGDSRYYTGVKLECSKDGTTWDTYRDTSVNGTYYESSSGKTVTIQ